MHRFTRLYISILLVCKVSTLTITRSSEGDSNSEGLRCSERGTLFVLKDESEECVKHVANTGCDLIIPSVVNNGPVALIPKNKSIDFNVVFESTTQKLCKAFYSPNVGAVEIQDYTNNIHNPVWNKEVGNDVVKRNIKSQFQNEDKEVSIGFKKHWPGQLMKIYIVCVNNQNKSDPTGEDSRCLVVKFEGEITYPLVQSMFEDSLTTTTTKTTTAAATTNTLSTTTAPPSTTITTKLSEKSTVVIITATTKQTTKHARNTTYGPILSGKRTDSHDDTALIGGLVGGMLFFLLIILILVLSILRIRKRKKKSSGFSEPSSKYHPDLNPTKTTIFNVNVNDPDAFKNNKYHREIDDIELPVYTPIDIKLKFNPDEISNSYEYAAVTKLRINGVEQPVLQEYAAVDKSEKTNRRQNGGNADDGSKNINKDFFAVI